MFPSKNINAAHALFLKEIALIRSKGINYIHYLVIILVPAYINVSVVKQVFILLAMLLLCIWGAMDILYPSIQEDKMEKNFVILKMAKVSCFKIYFIKSSIAFIFSILSVVLEIAINNVVVIIGLGTVLIPITMIGYLIILIIISLLIFLH